MCLMVSPIWSWENLPQLPSGKRNEYFVVKDNGGYEYGYDSGVGSFAKQSGSINNEVNGHFSYPSGNGELIDIKYTAGVDGYIPNTVTKSQTVKSGSASLGSNPINSGTHSYSYKTNHDSSNNGGSYSYTNSYGEPLSNQNSNGNAYSYTAQSVNLGLQSNADQSATDDTKWNDKSDASYGFAYNIGDSSRQETADSSGTVNGQYSFTNEDGLHEVEYVAGAQTGFKITGFKGFEPKTRNVDSSAWKTKKFDTPVVVYNVENVKSNGWKNTNGDASYKFAVENGAWARKEESNANGQVTGQYSYTDEAGQHDLKYLAGDDTGFIVTGGSLSVPNGLEGQHQADSRTNQGEWNTKYSTDDYKSTSNRFSTQSQNEGAYKLQYQVGGGSSQRNAQQHFSVTKLLPTSGNSKFGYILESK